MPGDCQHRHGTRYQGRLTSSNMATSFFAAGAKLVLVKLAEA
jgi:hypothetical protein